MNERERYLKLIDSIIIEYLNTPETERSLTKLSNKYGVKRQTIAKYLKARGHKVINYQNLCRIDETVFDIIDTEEKAYWLGFIYADGNISSVGHRFEINLSVKDIDHMLKLKNFLKYTGEIRFGKSIFNGKEFIQCRLSVRNEHLWNALNNKGCSPNKTLLLKFPNLSIFANWKLVYDFIRGYCDGDGTLGLYNNRMQIGFAGTEEFLKGIEDFIGIKGSLRSASQANRPNQIYILRYSMLKARKVARLLYEKSNIYLTRKFKIFESFCHFEEESSNAKSSKIGKSWNANTEVSSKITKGLETP